MKAIFFRWVVFLVVVAGWSGCASTAVRVLRAGDYQPVEGMVERGIASWYGPGFSGRRTASGEVFNPRDWTAAHPALPFGTVVEVRRVGMGRAVLVQITDRGPFVAGRIIDVSQRAAEELGLIGPGTAPVEVRVMRMKP